MIPETAPELSNAPSEAPQPKPPAPSSSTAGPRAWVGRIGPTIVLLACALFFVLPLLSMARFALQNVPMIRLGWSTLFDKWSLRFLTDAFDEPQFWPTLKLSLKLALGTVLVSLGLLVPTALYVNLRMPKARPFVEFLTVLPYVVPPIALVAGVAAFFRPNAKWYLNSDYALVPLYVVMALPFTYRSIDAGIRSIDLRTLVDASRSLGAGWVTTVRRVLLPNLSTSIVSATFLTATVVLGEFTIASTLAKTTFPTFSYEYFGRSAQGGIALALFTLVGSTALLGVLTVVIRRRARHRTAPLRPTTAVAPSRSAGQHT